MIYCRGCGNPRKVNVAFAMNAESRGGLLCHPCRRTPEYRAEQLERNRQHQSAIHRAAVYANHLERLAEGGSGTSDGFLSAVHDRGVPCRQCGMMRAITATSRYKAEGGPLCRACRRKNRPAPAPKVCDQCGVETNRVGNQNGRFCEDCIVERGRTRHHASDWRRRKRGSDLTGPVETEMKAASYGCPLCDVVMVDVPLTPWSKELDHIVPICVGGRHVRLNARIICRQCNMRRPKDGSDYDGPIMVEMWETVPMQWWMVRATAAGRFSPRVPMLPPIF